jgi:hypothetical protein
LSLYTSKKKQSQAIGFEDKKVQCSTPANRERLVELQRGDLFRVPALLDQVLDRSFVDEVQNAVVVRGKRVVVIEACNNMVKRSKSGINRASLAAAHRIDPYRKL